MSASSEAWPKPHAMVSSTTLRNAIAVAEDGWWRTRTKPKNVMPRADGFGDTALFYQLSIDGEDWWVPAFATDTKSPIPFTVGCYRVDHEFDARAQHFCCIAQEPVPSDL